MKSLSVSSSSTCLPTSALRTTIAQVVHGDIGAALRDLSPKSVDLIVAADVSLIVYFNLSTLTLSPLLLSLGCRSRDIYLLHHNFFSHSQVLCYLGDLKRIFSAASSALSPNGYFAFTVEAWLDASQSQAQASSLGAGEASSSSSSSLSASSREESGSSCSDSPLSSNSAAAAAAAAPAGTPISTMGWRMNVSGRYEHRKAHLEQLAAQHGLEVVLYEQVVARRRHADVDAEPVHAHLFVLTPRSAEQ